MDLIRHIHRCTNAVLPGARRRLFLAETQVGWVLPDVAQHPDAGDVRVADAAELDRLAAELEARGAFTSRHEQFDVRAGADGPVLATIDRGALPVLGIMAAGVHLNGIVRRPEGVFVWVARRARNKKLDPGKLDHIVGGGVPAGLSAFETLVKEAEEEAALPRSLIAQAVHVGRIGYAMEREEGLRRDVLDAYDLELPAGFQPRPADGEVESFELWPMSKAVDRVRMTDDFKFNVNLVLIDLFLRFDVLPNAEAGPVRAAMQRVYASGGAASIGMRVSPPG